jgi:hypothetical protein
MPRDAVVCVCFSLCKHINDRDTLRDKRSVNTHI